jgi:uncharacterized membrane protein YhaH (DUF805 family)
MDLVIQCVSKKYAQFSGRAPRKEFWLFALFYVVASVLLNIMDIFLDTIHPEMGFGYLYGLFYLLTLIPYFAVAVRRLHDTNRVGWWLLVGFVPILGFLYLIFLFCLSSDEGENRFG